jgi:hypothetical protein
VISRRFVSLCTEKNDAIGYVLGGSVSVCTDVHKQRCYCGELASRD